MKYTAKQTGATLVVSLIMLMVLTLLVVSAIRSSNTNLRIVGNMQMKGEVTSAAQQAIEQVLGTEFHNPPTQQAITINNGLDEYNVVVAAPVCLNTVAVSESELNPDDPEDRKCFGGDDYERQYDDEGNEVKKMSTCSRQTWDIQSTVADSQTGAAITVVQGVSRRVRVTPAC